MPLARTRAERIAAGDPRPSLEELYGDHDGYVRKVTAAAQTLKAQGLMLQEGVDWYVSEAQASSVLRQRRAFLVLAPCFVFLLPDWGSRPRLPRMALDHRQGVLAV